MREPTRIVRFTVVVGFEASGRVRMCRPLARAYSEMPSTDVTRVIPAGRRGVAAAAEAAPCPCADTPPATSVRLRPAATNATRNEARTNRDAKRDEDMADPWRTAILCRRPYHALAV